MSPTVSILVPTRDRRDLLPRLFHHIAQQDLDPSLMEVVLLDDGRDPVRDLVPDDPRYRYEALPQRVALGTKRNLLCEAARGEVLLHMDDDDWQAPTRVSAALAALADAPVVGRTSIALWDLAADTVHTTPAAGARHAHAGTLAYTRDFWRGHPWANDPRDEERQFLRNFVAPLGQLPGAPQDTLVAIVHGGNTRLVTRPFPRAEATIEDWLPADDLAFYRGLDLDGW